jgi:5-methylcytosine-specific restriction endonuclease McrA
MSWPYWIALAALAFFIGRSWLKSCERRAAFAAKQALLAKQAAAARAAYEIRWAPEAVFARRLRMDAAFVQDGTVDVDITARETTAGRFAGVIITSGGRELWRCRHHHSRQKRGGYRGSSARHESVLAARACAKKELSGSESHYAQRGSESRSLPRGKRAAIRDAGDENVEGLRHAFKGRCAYCGGPEQVLDHVVPLFLGGLNSFDNILPACDRCNLSKGTRRVLDFLASFPRSPANSTPWIPSHIVGTEPSATSRSPVSSTPPVQAATPAFTPAPTPPAAPVTASSPASSKVAPDWAIALVAEESWTSSTPPAQPVSDQTPWWRDDPAQ